MTPEFAHAVDPVFLYVLDLLKRIARDNPQDVDGERLQIRNRLDRAEQLLGDKEDWHLAKYALVAWIDEMLIDQEWIGREPWKEEPLEFELFNSSRAYNTFYEKATAANLLAVKDALEVFYVSVVLGFRGLYRDASGSALIEEMGLPATCEAWAKKTSMSIVLAQGRPPITESPRPGSGCPPLDGKFNLLGMSLACLCLLGIGGLQIAYLWFFRKP